MASAGAGAGLIIPAILKRNRTFALDRDPEPPNISKYTETLPVPWASPPQSNTLTIGRYTSHQFHSSLGPATTFAYNYSNASNPGDLLGPTIEATRGTPLTLTFKNNAAGPHPFASAVNTLFHGPLESDKTNPRMSVHLHGSNTEEKSDGYPTDTFTPGQSYTYNFNNNQEAATLWYHDHALGITGLNVLAGLAGFYLLRDIDDPAGGNGPLGLPAGEPYEVPIVLQDRFFNPDGTIFHSEQGRGTNFDGTATNPEADWTIEYVAPVATINGKAWPNFDVERTLYRFRIINGSSARTYSLKLSSNQPIIQIGTDQGLLNAPVYLSSLLMSPGERADVLIDFSDRLEGEKIVLQNQAISPYPYGRTNSFLKYDQLPELMQFTVKAGAANPKPIPKQLRLHKPLIKPIATPPIRQRYLTLVEIDDGPLPVVLLLNYVYWDEAIKDPELMERPKVDTVEQWNIINLQPVSHPMHLHLVPFQILNRQKIDQAKYWKAYLGTGQRKVILEHAMHGATVPANYPPPNPDNYTIGPKRPPAPNEAGWKDTVLAYPYEVTRIIVPFGANTAPDLPFGNSFTGTYVWHCHMLGHEDNEMMLPFQVVP